MTSKPSASEWKAWPRSRQNARTALPASSAGSGTLGGLSSLMALTNLDGVVHGQPDRPGPRTAVLLAIADFVCRVATAPPIKVLAPALHAGSGARWPSRSGPPRA